MENIARIGLVLGRERQRDTTRSRLMAREMLMASSGPGDNPVVFVIVRQADGTFGVEASDGDVSSFLTSFDTLLEAEAWIATAEGRPD
jgi:hypothetical protein